MEKYIVDRFEGEFAVLEKESGGMVDILKNALPPAHEGDVIIFENGVYKVSHEETQKRKELIAEKMRKLFENK
jgi:hypothetical protein